MHLKTILNRCHPITGFVYEAARFRGKQTIVVPVRADGRRRGICSFCGDAGPTYDTAAVAREFEFIPCWGFFVVLLYAMRRIDCARCGVRVEKVPWADGKEHTCNAYQLFLATWAKRLSWSETARVFHTSWRVVYRSVAWVVAYGLEHRNLDGVSAIGVDEIAVWKGHKYLTVVYQIDKGIRRLLWVGRDRTKACMNNFFDDFGAKHTAQIKFIASDMWKNYIDVIAKRASGAVHVLDRFHIVANLNKALDAVRAQEARELARRGFETLKHTRWCFLKREKNLTRQQRVKLSDVLRYDLRSVRAYLHKEALEGLWHCRSAKAAGEYLDGWCKRVMRSRIEPIKKIARSLRNHRPLILNWFVAKKEINSGIVEALNSLAKLGLRRARGFRTFETMQVALFHQLGRLPEPLLGTHQFW
jgi:transposase